MFSFISRDHVVGFVVGVPADTDVVEVDTGSDTDQSV